MRTIIRSLVLVCALSTALLVAGCGKGASERPGRTTGSPRPVTDVDPRHAALPGESGIAAATSAPESLSDEIGPARVPEIPDLPDGGGLVPDDPDASDDFGAPVGTDGMTGTDDSSLVGGVTGGLADGAAGSIFDSPTDFFVH
ncbi:hypothetical protein [Streptomyces sp. NPDC002265]|uniref:hypothetical protein n=1 Tax=Streptomyces sp. NPDC002265 TaxID=3154415 RepID=UPI0033203FF0